MIPVIITHRGNQGYFQCAVHQALNCNERVILIGDESNKDTPGVEYYSEQELRSAAVDAFEANYIHMHTKAALAYRRADISRWFLIARIAKELGLPTVFACDSDLMLYADVSAAEPMAKYGLACSIPAFQPEFRWSASGHASYWKLDTLNDFCAFAGRAYTDIGLLKKLESKWDWHRQTGTPGGICDMTLLWLFIQDRNAIDLCTPRKGTVFDHNFNETGGYRMTEIAKEIEWRGGRPHGYHLGLKEWIRFNALHFQGRAKRLIQDYERPC